jgi:hypothetical protein
LIDSDECLALSIKFMPAHPYAQWKIKPAEGESRLTNAA